MNERGPRDRSAPLERDQVLQGARQLGRDPDAVYRRIDEVRRILDDPNKGTAPAAGVTNVSLARRRNRRTPSGRRGR